MLIEFERYRLIWGESGSAYNFLKKRLKLLKSKEIYSIIKQIRIDGKNRIHNLSLCYLSDFFERY